VTIASTVLRVTFHQMIIVCVEDHSVKQFNMGLTAFHIMMPCKGKGKGKGQVLDIVLLRNEHMLRSALQSRKWQLIGMS